MFGHTLGAAGSIEFVVCALGLYHGFIPPTIHLEDTIADIGSDKLYFVKNKALFREYSVAISNSFGFAGNMAAIVAKKYKQ
jgi:3-oxoacyl-[acyl-carrier-protein] synthase II